MHPRLNTNILKKIEGLISEMTLEEKVSLCHASKKFAVGGVPRLGIQEFEMSDGPHGVRQEISADSWVPAGWTTDFATYLPTGTATAATWNPDLARKLGEVLGAEARDRNKDFILGPGFNIIRTPLCGRNFEYFGEDPKQISDLVVEMIKGIQSKDVAACAKHFLMNNQELNRFKTDVKVSERALKEIYLPVFEAAVKEGGVLSVMGAYNKFRGQYCCHNEYAVNCILKGDWGFEGVYVSDWAGTHDTYEAVSFGLDIEMGTSEKYDEYFLAKPYLEGLKNGKYDEETLNDKVRRILKVLYAIGKFDSQRCAGARNIKEHQEIAYEGAVEAAVLLKNDGVLPFDADKIKTLAVLGDNATRQHHAGGQSSAVKALYEISPLEAIQRKFGDKLEILHTKSYPETVGQLLSIESETMATVDQGSGTKGWIFDAFSHEWDDEYLIHREFTEAVKFDLNNAPVYITETMKEKGYYLRWRGNYESSNKQILKLAFDTNTEAMLHVDGELLIAVEAESGINFKAVDMQVESGRSYEMQIILRVYKSSNSFKFGICSENKQKESEFKRALELAKKADAVIFCGGLNHQYDVEGYDRQDMKLPDGQDELIAEIAKVNQNLALLMISGSPYEMPWINSVPALLQGWYAGMECGNAFADILFGKVSPSGKLAMTFPKSLNDCPAHSIGSYEEDCSEYNEDVYVGYRYYDRHQIQALFPFGHGLTYSHFVLSGLFVNVEDESLVVSVKVRNIGGVSSKQTVQFYVEDTCSDIDRPIRELRAFRKLFIESKKSSQIDLSIPIKSLAYYCEQKRKWILDKGHYLLHVGFSSRDLRLVKEFELNAFIYN